jgi:predicted O-methyltransferase YrrM
MYKENEIAEYIKVHSDKEDPILYELFRMTNIKMINPRMVSGHIQGLVLEQLSKMIKPERILEIGTYTGYSAICLAKGLANKGKLTTIEKNDELIPFAEEYFKKAGLEKKIEMIAGNAIEYIIKTKERFDLVFIDGDKKEYRTYYDNVLPKLKKDGYIFIDNVLWNNKIIEEPRHEDKETKAIIDFNDYVSKDNRVEKVILPLRDGIFIIRKK